MVLKAGAALAMLATLPRAVLAAAWPEKAFGSTAADDAMTGLFGTTDTTVSDQISLSAPEIAENGAVVPIEISTTLADVESISIVVPNNPRPLAASFEVPAGTPIPAPVPWPGPARAMVELARKIAAVACIVFFIGPFPSLG